jgi:NitT/TauT family transport system permease protein
LVGRVNSVYIIVFLVIFPIIFENIIGGVYSISDDILDAFALEPSTLIQTFTYIYLPLTLSYIKIALLQSVGLGFKVLVMAEFIAQTRSSIGAKLYEASISIDYSTIFAWSIIIIGLAISIEISIHKIKSK